MDRAVLRESGRLATIAAVYFVAGRVGLLLAFVNESATAVWPPTGIALAAVLLYGPRIAVAILAGAFFVNLTTSGSVVASIGIAIGNTLEAVVGGLLVERYAGGRRAFERADNTFRFAGLAALGATTISATLGLASLAATGLTAPGSSSLVWLTWWLGDASGAMLITPLVVLWADRQRHNVPRARLGEGLLLLVTVTVTGLIVFAGVTAAGRSQVPLAFLCLPGLLWAAFRFGPRETATCSAILSIIAIRGTITGFGPYAAQGREQGLLILQTFIGIITVTSLAAAAEAWQRRAREADLRTLNDELERRVSARTLDLQKAQERLKEAQQVAHVGSWEWDIVSDTVWWSDELYRIFGVEPARFSASYRAFIEHVHPDDAARVDAVIREALVERQPFAFEHRVRCPDGDVRVVSSRGDVVVNAEEVAVRMRGTAQDITERQRADEARAALTREQVARVEAEEANRLKDQFLATLSHELRTPLHAVIGWAHMLLRGAVDEKRQHRAVELIYRNAMIQSQMISDLLDVSRVTAGTLTLEKELIDLPAILDTAIEAMRPSALEKGIEIEASVDEAAWIQGDAKRLAQVASNLLVNAIKFTPQDGRIIVALARTQTAVELRISDTGPGISPDFLPHVFDRFRQEDASVTREHGGLGLGLAIVRHIVELHGGRVSAQNRPQGSGAVFIVRLPALSGQETAGMRDPAAV